jgi:hypothetical protein
MASDKTTAILDGDGMELPPKIVRVATKWLIYQYAMTEADATKVMATLPRGPTRQRQRAEAIDVADFVETLSRDVL